MVMIGNIKTNRIMNIFYSILFYSILFYSILFCLHVPYCQSGEKLGLVTKMVNGYILSG